MLAWLLLTQTCDKCKELNFTIFLEAQLLYDYIDVTDSLTGRLAVSAISPLFVDGFGRSLRSFHQEFDKEAIFDGFIAHSLVL